MYRLCSQIKRPKYLCNVTAALGALFPNLDELSREMRIFQTAGLERVSALHLFQTLVWHPSRHCTWSPDDLANCKSRAWRDDILAREKRKTCTVKPGKPDNPAKPAKPEKRTQDIDMGHGQGHAKHARES